MATARTSTLGKEGKDKDKKGNDKRGGGEGVRLANHPVDCRGKLSSDDGTHQLSVSIEPMISGMRNCTARGNGTQSYTGYTTEYEDRASQVHFPRRLADPEPSHHYLTLMLAKRFQIYRCRYVI